VIFAGLCGLGFSAAMVAIPIFPEMLNSIEIRYPDIAGDELNNISAGYFNSCLGLGEALGPISASLLSHTLGFRMAEDILATLMLCYVAVFFFINGGLFLISYFKERFMKTSSDDDFRSADR
jgi:MFS family permease